MQRKVLGKGLSALIPHKPVPVTKPDGPVVRDIPTQMIFPNPYQPRKDFDPNGMKDLISSVKSRGLIQPVLVREGKGGFELIAGERRWRAAKKAGITAIPALVRSFSDQDSLEIALIENLQREDLNPMESAEAYGRLIKEFRLTQEDLSSRVGKGRTTITNTMRLLSLPQELKEYVRKNKITAGHAKALLSIPGKAQQIAAGREIIRRSLSVRDTEKRAKKIIVEKSGGSKSFPKERDIHLTAVEEDLKRVLGTKVRIVSKKDRGKIEIEYYSKKERERLIAMLRGSAQN
jgi:ParB family chromosome partitioning protein